MTLCRLLVFILLIPLPGAIRAQAPADSIPVTAGVAAADTLTLHSPRKAALYSAVLPGLGQAYNKKYWKMPIVYAGLATSIYFVSWNSGKYGTYRDAYVARVDEDSTTIDDFPLYSPSDIKTLRDYYHRNLEISYIATGVIYLLNIVDASVDAHLFDFDISDDLGMTLQPASLYTGSGYIPGMRFCLNF